MSPIPKIEKFRDVSKFVSRLLPTNPSWRERPNYWIYRGQRDANWQLIPTALRRSVDLDLVRSGEKGIKPSYGKQISAELQVLDRFFEKLDFTGIAIPEDGQIFRSANEYLTIEHQLNQIRKGEEPWPPIPYLSTLALAQHYGLPTRLLDWSRSALVAAYFSAEGCSDPEFKIESDEDRISVWVLNGQFVRLCEYESHHGGKMCEIGLVSAPSSSNPNLFAQKGVFTFPMIKQKAEENTIVRPLEHSIERMINERESEPDWFVLNDIQKDTVLQKFTLPQNKAPELLFELNLLGIDASTVFPGQEGCARAVKETIKYGRST